MKISDITVQRGERGLAVGETGVGKSTLCNMQLDKWAETDRQAHILIIDSKPRFKAEWQLTGIPAKKIYQHWEHGTFIPYSYRLPVGATPKELRQAWDIARTTTPDNRGLVLIAQVPINEQAAKGYFPWLDEMIRAHYAHINKKFHNYTYVDEMLAFMRESRRNQGGAIQVITAGRELGHTFLGGTQRPFWIPSEAMSEMTHLFCFFLSTKRDKGKIFDIGLPDDFIIPGEYHEFNHYSKKTRKQSILRLPESLAKRYS